MSGIRLLGILALMLVLAVGCGMNTAATGEGDGDADKKIADLQKRVDALEKQIQQLRASGGAAAAPNAQLEKDATAAYQKIDRMISSGQVEQAKTELATFNKKYGQTNVARSAARLTRELAVVGKDSPSDWKIDKWFQGEDKIDLSSNKATLLVFWETWCPHCRREVPKVQQVYDKYSGKGLQVVGLTKVTKSATEQGVAEFISQNNLSYPVAKENGEISKYFNVSGIPAAAVYKGGKIVWRGHPVKLTDTMIESWL